MRILITGNAGSGKTWLAARLAGGLSVPLIGLDAVYWSGTFGGVERPKAEVVREVAARAEEAAWVIEGVYGWLLPAALPRATQFVFIDLPVEDCLANLRSRGKQGGETDAAFEAMLAWAGDYPIRQNANSRSAHLRLWEAFAGDKAMLGSRDEVGRFFGRLVA